MIFTAKPRSDSYHSSSQKKLGFTLIEVIISFILVSVLGTTLFTLSITLRNASLGHESAMKSEEKRLAQAHLIRTYLSSIIIDENKLSGKGSASPFFVTEGTNGTAHFKVYTSLLNGIDTVQSLSNEVLAQFTLSPDGLFSLYLKTHPARGALGNEEESSIRLWEDVESISWQFARLPQDEKTTPSRKGVSTSLSPDINEAPYGVWLTEWKREWKNSPPALIKLTLCEKNGHTEVITAIIPEAIQSIYLEKE
jgi:type II secretory pathway component PulJ